MTRNDIVPAITDLAIEPWHSSARAMEQSRHRSGMNRQAAGSLPSRRDH